MKQFRRALCDTGVLEFFFTHCFSFPSTWVGIAAAIPNFFRGERKKRSSQDDFLLRARVGKKIARFLPRLFKIHREMIAHARESDFQFFFRGGGNAFKIHREMVAQMKYIVLARASWKENSALFKIHCEMIVQMGYKFFSVSA